MLLKLWGLCCWCALVWESLSFLKQKERTLPCPDKTKVFSKTSPISNLGKKNLRVDKWGSFSWSVITAKQCWVNREDGKKSECFYDMHSQTLQSWMINAVSCYMAKTQGFSHPWILAEVFFGGSRQQCQNSSPSFNHYYCFIYMKVQHEKDPLPLKEPLQWCVTVCAEARICNGLLIRSSNKKNEVEACILFAVHLLASKKKKSPFLKHM